MRKLWPLFLAIASLAAGQELAPVAKTIQIHGHGGWAETGSAGLDRFDRLVIDIRCDHDILGECADGDPYLQEDLLITDTFTTLEDGTPLVTRDLLGPARRTVNIEIDQAEHIHFKKVLDEFQHQIWEVWIPRTYNHIFVIQYFWVGWGVNYWITVTANEVVKL